MRTIAASWSFRKPPTTTINWPINEKNPLLATYETTLDSEINNLDDKLPMRVLPETMCLSAALYRLVFTFVKAI